MQNNNCFSKDCGCGTPPSSPILTRRQFLVSTGVFALSSTHSFPLGPREADNYEKAIRSHPHLRGYWRLEDNLKDSSNNKLDAESRHKLNFADGAIGGKGLHVSENQVVSVSDTENFEGESATLELFFKLTEKPKEEYDQVIIAQAIQEQVRFIIGIKNDLSGLIYTEGRVPTTVILPTGLNVEIDKWYHLVATSNELDLRLYIDGHECTLKGGALHFTRPNRGKISPIMTFGTMEGESHHASIVLDEIAYIGKALSIQEIQNQLKTGDWENRLQEVGSTVARLERKRNIDRQSAIQRMLKDPALFDRGETKLYSGEHLQAISFTVGGIGSGAIQFDGQGQPAIWQIAGNLTNPRIPNSFLAIRVGSNTRTPVVRALQTVSVGPFRPMNSLNFKGEYPFAWYDFEDPKIPIDLKLEIFNPLIPLDTKNSGIPCVIYNIKVNNISRESVDINLLASQQNALGYTSAQGVIEDRRSNAYGGNLNNVVKRKNGTYLHMTRQGDVIDPSDMVLMTTTDNATFVESWNSLVDLHQMFLENGNLENSISKEPSPAGLTMEGALSVPLSVEPGESKTVTFALSWFFPNADHGRQKSPWKYSGSMYENWWKNALDVGTYLSNSLEELSTRTRKFHNTFYDSNLPQWLLDRLSSQLAVLRSQTCWWSKDGYFGVWEGCAPERGCCGGNCTHVWHYAQAHARLFPEIGRKMREQDFDHQLENGLVPSRHLWERTAADGHFGTILNSYREYLCSVDDAWLKTIWPKIKQAMDAGIVAWDPDQNGFLQNFQHNTLDGQMAGCSSWIGTLYLSALEASAIMAKKMGEPEAAAKYRKIRKSGILLQNKRLWNGEYYIQEAGKERIEDYLDGCHIDQILGEWWADQLNLPRNYPEERARTAMASLLKNNFFPNFHGLSLKPRQFVTVDNAGMKMITWPRNPQPIPGMKYGDEVMTGFEYGAGVSMIQHDLQAEGLMVLKAVYDRYNGKLLTDGITNMTTGAWGYSGNPFGDDECGKFYGRSLSVWSALLALQGFIYDGPSALIGFSPRWKPEDHSSFFTVADGYGLYTQKVGQDKQSCSILLKEGKLQVKEVELAFEKGLKAKDIKVHLNDQTYDHQYGITGQRIRIKLRESVLIRSEQTLNISILFN